MNYLLFAIAAGLAAYVIISKKKREAADLETLRAKPTTKGTISTAVSEDVPPLDEALRIYTPMDVPMIQARFDKLEIIETLEANQQDKLRRSIMDYCQEKKNGIWWDPLADFAKTLRIKGELPALVFNAEDTRAGAIQNTLETLSFILRQSTILLQGIQNKDGVFTPGTILENGSYQIKYKHKEVKGTFPIKVGENGVDAQDLVKGLNGILRKGKHVNRMVLLAPSGSRWCLVRCSLTAAQRAAKAKWGQLLAPSN
jgi:hypothetical protein